MIPLYAPTVTGTCVSSFVILPVAVPVATVAPTAPEMVTVRVSSCSIATSPTTPTEMVFDVSPGPKVTVPLAAAQSDGAGAVPSAVASGPDTGCVLSAESVTGKDSGVVPAFPSVTDASPTDTDGRPWIRYVATRDAFVEPSLIVTATLSVLPVALGGTTSETRAVPP